MGGIVITRLTRFARRFVDLNSCFEKQKEEQLEEGYSLELHYEGLMEPYGLYYEGDRTIVGVVAFSLLNEVTIFEDSLKRWRSPKDEPLTHFEFLRVRNRFRRFFECWGEVNFDSSILPTQEDLKASLEKSGIPFKEVDGFVIYGSTPEEERKRKAEMFREKNRERNSDN
ncbi:MAG TPA: hypothetical protein VMM38_07915 [Aridibacter sp.]|nr:hypothetical protein [Aridibacter sp.]